MNTVVTREKLASVASRLRANYPRTTKNDVGLDEQARRAIFGELGSGELCRASQNVQANVFVEFEAFLARLE